MHMAEGLISAQVGVAFWAASATVGAWAAREVTRNPKQEFRTPLMGVLGAFIFAAQMINFPIPGTGSSGHLGGGLLLAILLGPWAAFLTMATVLLVQCLLFGDGGLLALGCNIFNLAFWPSFVGLGIFRVLSERIRRSSLVLASMIAVVLSLELGALGVVVQTLLSGRSQIPFGLFTGLMLGIHLPIAIVEGLVTAAVVAYARKTMPERLESTKTVATSQRRLTALATFFLAALFIGAVVAWFASSKPDGLEWSLGKATGTEELPTQGTIAEFLGRFQEKTALLPDYSFRSDDKQEPAIDEDSQWPSINVGTSFAGIVGTLLTALVALALGALLRLTSKPGARYSS